MANDFTPYPWLEAHHYVHMRSSSFEANGVGDVSVPCCDFCMGDGDPDGGYETIKHESEDCATLEMAEALRLLQHAQPYIEHALPPAPDHWCTPGITACDGQCADYAYGTQFLNKVGKFLSLSPSVQGVGR